MGPDTRSLLDDPDLHLPDLITESGPSLDKLVMFRDAVLQVKRSRQICRPGSDKHHVHFDLFSFDHCNTLLKMNDYSVTSISRKAEAARIESIDHTSNWFLRLSL